MGRGPGFCPKCGERVTPFAAGCAICGADLDPNRHRPSRFQLPSFPGFSSRTALVAILLLLTLFAPFLSVIVCAWIAYDRDRGGDEGERNVAIAFLVISVLMVLAPAARFGLLQLIGVV